ncbi:MAG: omptin family outer membrane protease [Treponema sp.]|nr:omptin family outer membrane protease [Treponema sp.]
MKNITALTVLVIILSAITSKFPLSGQELKKERNYTLSIAPQFGILDGEALEIVYPTVEKGELLSELIWEMNPLFYWGAGLDYSLIEPMKRPGFFSALSIKAGFPGETGKMEDRDWQSIENGALTNFSSHTNITEDFFCLDISMGISIPVGNLFLFKTFIGGSWMNLSFTGRDGHGIYARGNPRDSGKYFPMDDNPDRRSFNGRVITYSQEWLILSAGAGIGIGFLEHFLLDLSFQISPLTFCYAEDNHILTRYTYIDISRFGIFLEPRCKLSFTPVGWLGLSLDFAYRQIGPAKGESFYRVGSSGGYHKSENRVGAGLSLLDYGLSVKVIF